MLSELLPIHESPEAITEKIEFEWLLNHLPYEQAEGMRRLPVMLKELVNRGHFVHGVINDQRKAYLGNTEVVSFDLEGRLKIDFTLQRNMNLPTSVTSEEQILMTNHSGIKELNTTLGSHFTETEAERFWAIIRNKAAKVILDKMAEDT